MKASWGLEKKKRKQTREKERKSGARERERKIKIKDRKGRVGGGLEEIEQRGREKEMEREGE